MTHRHRTYDANTSENWLVGVLREQGWSLLAFALVFAALIGKMRLTRWLALGFFGTNVALAADKALIVFLVGVTWLIPRPRRRIGVLWVVDAVLTFVLLATSVYAAYFGRLWTPGLLALVGQAGTVASSIFELFDPIHIWYVADFPLLFILTWLVVRGGTGGAEKAGRYRVPSKRFATPVTVGVVVFAVAWIVAVGFATSAQRSRHEQAVAREYGLFAFQAASMLKPLPSLSSAVADVEIRDPDAVNGAIDDVLGTEGVRRSSDVDFGVARGRSVIIVQFEALQSLVLGRRVDGVDVTPNLDALGTESWYFPNTVGQTGEGGTADAEFIFNTSLYSPEAGAASTQYHRKRIPSLPRVLVSQGIETYTFHTNDVRFWNRDMLYPALGYTAYYDQEYFGEEDIVGFGASDEVLYDKTLDELLRLRDGGTPFCAELVSMSSHHPFDPLPESKDPLVPQGAYRDTTLGAYISSINYADRAFGAFVDELKRTGLYDECVLVVFGDHFGLREPYPEGRDGEAARELLGRPYTYLDMTMVPMFVHLPGQREGHTVEDVVGQVDIMPTVTDVLGIDVVDQPVFGRSVFVDWSRPVLYPVLRPIPVGSYVSDDALVIADIEDGQADATPLSDPETIEPATTAQIDRIADVDFLLELSDVYARTLPER